MSGESRIRQLLTRAVDEGVFPGAVFLVARCRQVFFFEAAGNAALLPTPWPMTRETRFDLASLTKPLATTLAVLYLMSQGKLHLDAPLADLLAGVPVPADREKITLRQLLCHCSGLPAWRPYYLSVGTVPGKACKAQLREQILREPLDCAPGTRSVYSDLGFLLIQWIVEQASGHELHHFIHKHLFAPLGCATLGYLPLDSEKENDPHDFAATEFCAWRGRILCGQVHDENAYVLGGVAGHAGLFGTASEVMCVLNVLLDTLASRSVPLPWSRDDLLQFLRPAGIDPHSTWALGFDTPAASGSSTGHHFSPETVGHLGFTGTSFWLDLRREMAVILLSNRIHPLRANQKIRGFRPLLHDAIMEEFG
ncbi:MAG: serine hydrolase domain-containing protein [Syntrophobacteria bacterium]